MPRLARPKRVSESSRGARYVEKGKVRQNTSMSRMASDQRIHRVTHS